jgi:hypothetical protein
MGLYAHPSAGVGPVVNGVFVCIDGDIRPKPGEPNHDERLAAARDLMPRLVRCTHNLKFRLLYAPASVGDAVTIDIVDNPIEIFGDPSSAHQIVIYGPHPDAGVPYAWIGGVAPPTHGPEHLPRVTAEQLREYHDAANALAHAHQSAHSRNDRNGRPRRHGSIGPFIAATRRNIGRQPHRDPRQVARETLSQAHERYNTMSGCVGALIISGPSDQQIIEALEDTYRQLFTADELRNHMAAFYASPTGLRKAMSRGLITPLLPVAEIEQQLNVAAWSLFRPRGGNAR